MQLSALHPNPSEAQHTVHRTVGPDGCWPSFGGCALLRAVFPRGPGVCGAYWDPRTVWAPHVIRGVWLGGGTSLKPRDPDFTGAVSLIV